jgi:hypothetical protein
VAHQVSNCECSRPDVLTTRACGANSKGAAPRYPGRRIGVSLPPPQNSEQPIAFFCLRLTTPILLQSCLPPVYRGGNGSPDLHPDHERFPPQEDARR